MARTAERISSLLPSLRLREMVPPLQSTVQNNLLLSMATTEFAALAPYLENVDLPRLYALSSPGVVPTYCYFPDSGICSIVAGLNGGRKAEVGIFGREGMSPTSVVMQAPTAPYSVFMQIAGRGHRIRITHLSHALEVSFDLRSLLLRFAQVMSVQSSYTALSNATDNIEQRLARWLLMCHDRLDGNPVNLTHSFLSTLLAVRRQSITMALHVLEGHHLVVAKRNLISLRNRKGLEEFAGTAYGPAEDEYRRLIGQL